MKKTNKGFSMVELIIVIAIMAILAGALAPALIKYINKSRLSTDISTGQSIAEAVQTALSNEGVYEDAKDAEMKKISQLEGNKFKNAVVEALSGTSDPKGKSKKHGAAGTAGTFADHDFYIVLNANTSKVEVYYGSSTKDAANMVYPTVGNNLKSEADSSSSTGGSGSGATD